MILPFNNVYPRIDRSVFVAPGAVIIGDVVIGADTSIWFGSIVRGDVNYIRIGEKTNVQDQCVLHVTGDCQPLLVGSGITVGHRAILHSCTVEDGCLIGMGAILLDGCHVGPEAVVAAGSVVSPGAQIPARTLAMGVPARPRRQLTSEELARAQAAAVRYHRLAAVYREEIVPAAVED